MKQEVMLLIYCGLFPHNHIHGLQRTVPKKEGKQFNGGQLQYVMEIALLLPEVRGQN